MRALLTFVLLLTFSVNAYSLGGYGSLTEGQQNALKTIVNQLGISDNSNDVKYKIYDNHSFIFDSDWDSYWIGLNDLASSKFKDGKEKGFIEICINNEKNGTLFVTFVYKPDLKQIIVTSRQVRYGDKKLLLDEYEKRKGDKETYEVKHEKNSYGLLQEKGKVSFEFFHVGNSSGSIVYLNQSTIDI